jgi:hypothetical protein
VRYGAKRRSNYPAVKRKTYFKLFTA